MESEPHSAAVINNIDRILSDIEGLKDDQNRLSLSLKETDVDVTFNMDQLKEQQKMLLDLEGKYKKLIELPASSKGNSPKAIKHRK